jgi:Pretoxin HINT domain
MPGLGRVPPRGSGKGVARGKLPPAEEGPVAPNRSQRPGVGKGSRTPFPLQMRKQISCFVAGTPIVTPQGYKLIEDIVPGDLVLSSPQDDATGPVEPRVVQHVFMRVSRVIELRVRGRVIKTTPEHPFWVLGKGWRAAGLLETGDLLRSHDGQWLSVESVRDQCEVTTVYNFEVAEYHTYYVGCEDWGFSIWAHNLGGCDVWVAMGGNAEEFPKLPETQRKALNEIAGHIEAGRVKDARQALQGQGLSGKKAGDLIDTLQNPPTKATPPPPAPAAPTTHPPSPAAEMARHSVEESGHWNNRIAQLVGRGMTREAATQQAISEAEALINQIRNAPNVRKYTAPDGQTMYWRPGDNYVIKENPVRREGTIYDRKSTKAAEEHFLKFKKDHPGGI